jgi:nucleotide-binding universal stress UspA family protein
MKINIKRILCPTDMSPQSDEALRYAIALARAYQAQLVVCHCVDSSALAEES